MSNNYYFKKTHIDGQCKDLRRLVPLGLLLDQLPLGVDSEDPAQRYPNLLIGKSVLRGDTMIIVNTRTTEWQQ